MVIQFFCRFISLSNNLILSKRSCSYFKNKEVIWNGVLLGRSNYPSEEFIKSCDEERKNKLNVKIKEVEIISGFFDFFPTKISDYEWSVLIKCDTLKQTLDQIIFFKKKELLKERDKIKEEVKKNKKVVEKNSPQPLQVVGINNFPIGMNKSIIKYENQNYTHSLLLNNTPKIVIDCRYIPNLSIRAQHLTGLQISYVISDNRKRLEPWPVCLANFTYSLNESVIKQMNFLKSEKSLDEVSTKNYTEIYDSSKVVYLSPDAEDELEHIKGDEVFVIGGIVDRVTEHNIPKHASLEAAMKDNVRCAKLPLDKYVKWKSGRKYLTLTAVVNILQDVYDSNDDWNYSLQKNIPVRNVRGPEEKHSGNKELLASIREYNKRVLSAVEEKLNYCDIIKDEQ